MRARGRNRARWVDLIKTRLPQRKLDWNQTVKEEEWWKDGYEVEKCYRCLNQL